MAACVICLTKDRRLKSVHKSLITQLVGEFSATIDPEQLSRLNMCWECGALVQNVIKLNDRVKKAQQVLQIGESHVKSISTLGTCTKIGFDYQFEHEATCSSPTPSHATCISQDLTWDPALDLNVSFDYDQIESRLRELDHIDLNLEDDLMAKMNDETSVNRNAETKTSETVNVKVTAAKSRTNSRLSSASTECNVNQTNKKKNIESFCIVMRDLTRKPNIKNCSEQPSVTVRKMSRDRVKEVQLMDSSEVKQKLLSMVNKQPRKRKKKDNVSLERLIEEKLKYKTVMMSEIEMLQHRHELKYKSSYIESKYKCETCILGFSTKLNFLEHKLKKHAMDVGIYQCDICGVRFSTEDRRTKHRRTHYLKKVNAGVRSGIKCPYCNKSFKCNDTCKKIS